jgi:hypothetical protein
MIRPEGFKDSGACQLCRISYKCQKQLNASDELYHHLIMLVRRSTTRGLSLDPKAPPKLGMELNRFNRLRSTWETSGRTSVANATAGASFVGDIISP